MLTPALLDGLSAAMIETPRLKTHVITRGPEDGIPVMLVHGNASAARFYEELMVALPAQYRVIAPDLRGYGRSERKRIDATRGVSDFSDDLKSLVDTLGLGRFHLLGWSLGGNVALQYAIDNPGDLRSLTLMAAGSPYGFGGSHGPDGTANNPEFAGSGGGTASPDLVKRLAEGDRSDEAPTSPRNVMNSLYFKPPFRAAREEVFLDEMLIIGTGPTSIPATRPRPRPGPASAREPVVPTIRSHRSTSTRAVSPRSSPSLPCSGFAATAT
jgi:pimeloyl-ACP methyl ester carboxylesterase